jgi:hypothetical protein
MIAQPVFSEQADPKLSGIKRIFVEMFPAKTGSEKLRQDLIAELRRLGSPSIVASESDADAILTGDGETWIKGYRSLNPRSGRLPSDGEPVYAGFLSVELRDAKGETLWSYLETLGPTSDNISKDLAKQVVKRLMDALK